MAAKPEDITLPTAYVTWDHASPMECPLCGKRLVHEFNDGGRKVVTMRGAIWVITNYYRCTSNTCDLRDAFPAAHEIALTRKKHGLNVWAKVIQHRFKHKLNYAIISEMMWDDWEVSISKGTVRAICEYFEVAGTRQVDETTRRVIKAQGKIVLSLDGAQPKKGRPAFWVFTDRVSGRILLTRYLEKASTPVLRAIFDEIEKKFGTRIVAVISDKQRSIVNAVKEFNPSVRHAFCQYHFLHHTREPIAAKDSHLLTYLRSKIKSLSIVQNRVTGDPGFISSDTPVHVIFTPIAEELLCAISTRGDRFKIFPGLEAHTNLEYVLELLGEMDVSRMPGKILHTISRLIGSIREILDDCKALVEEIVVLVMDFNELRAMLSKRKKSGKYVRKAVNRWVYKLQSRLKRRSAIHDPGSIKWMQARHDMSLVEVWQQWIRLVASYEDGLYQAYDDPDLDFTNNAKESLFSRTKHHFRSTYGRDDVQDQFEVHAGYLVKLLDLEYEPENINEVLLASETALVEAERHDLHARYATTRRIWKIREQDTKNVEKFKDRLDALVGCVP
ncbi:MAG: hypothetical protein ACFFCS_14110 [Candidatus Hodarchaeota archaeon]